MCPTIRFAVPTCWTSKQKIKNNNCVNRLTNLVDSVTSKWTALLHLLLTIPFHAVVDYAFFYQLVINYIYGGGIK